ncbi:MAG: hypothetical protein ACI80I_002218, partial [Akkermansiaceae bacterium]
KQCNTSDGGDINALKKAPDSVQETCFYISDFPHTAPAKTSNQIALTRITLCDVKGCTIHQTSR